jgi:hypothetical protein
MMFLAYEAYEVGSYVRTHRASLIRRVIVRQASRLSFAQDRSEVYKRAQR